MSESSVQHPSAEELLRWSAGETSAEQRPALQEHLDTCEECTASVRELEADWEEYLVLHEQALKPALPNPPRPWDDLRARMTPIERTWRHSVRWAAIAASVLVCLVVVQRFRQPPAVSAAELLSKAASAETRSARRARIQIRTRSRSLVRPAWVSADSTSPDTRELRARFEAAGYAWDDPLSARSFAAWRNRLAEKWDEVTQAPATGGTEARYNIRTSTNSGDLRQVTLSLRQADLRPVAEQLQFRDETVDITELPEAAPSLPPAKTNITGSPAAINQIEPPGPGEELHAIAALHDIGADLGEPIEVTREATRVLVTASGLNPARREQVREALSKLPGVILQFGEGSPSSSLVASGRAGASPEELANRLLESSDVCMARAFALRNLAVRFSPAVETQLQPADRSLLTSLRLEHVRILSISLKQLIVLLKPVFADLDTGRGQPAPEAASNWQAGAQSVLEATRRLDQLLNRTFAGSDQASLPEVPEALRQLQRQIAAYEKAGQEK